MHNNNNRELIERFQKLKALYNWKEKKERKTYNAQILYKRAKHEN